MRVLVLGLVALSLSDAFMLRCSRQGAGCHVAVSCVFMQDDGQPPDQKAAELAKEIPFAAYKPNKMKFKGTEVGNVPMGGALGERLSGPAKFMPYAALLTALALLTGGLTEDLVGELVRLRLRSVPPLERMGDSGVVLGWLDMRFPPTRVLGGVRLGAAPVGGCGAAFTWRSLHLWCAHTLSCALGCAVSACAGRGRIWQLVADARGTRHGQSAGVEGEAAREEARANGLHEAGCGRYGTSGGDRGVDVMRENARERPVSSTI